MRLLLCAVLLAGVGCGRGPGQPPGSKVEIRADPRSAEEKLVKAYLLEKLNDPSSLEIASWGPHFLEGENWPVIKTKDKDRPKARIFRVCYRTKNALGAKVLVDVLFTFADNKIIQIQPNEAGDEWREITALGIETDNFIGERIKNIK